MLAVISAMRHQIVGWHWTHLKRHLDDGREDDFTTLLSLVEFGPRRSAVRGSRGGQILVYRPLKQRSLEENVRFCFKAFLNGFCKMTVIVTAWFSGVPFLMHSHSHAIFCADGTRRRCTPCQMRCVISRHASLNNLLIVISLYINVSDTGCKMA
jgi:hypothetical protein